MDSGIPIARLLGVAFLFVFVAIAVSDVLLSSAVGEGSMSEMLVSAVNNLVRLRISNLVALLNSVGIVVLAVLLYQAFGEQHRIIAQVALGWWLAEAVVLALSRLSIYALIPLSQDFVQAGAPAGSHYQTLAQARYQGLNRQGYVIHMLFLCLGGVLWTYLLFASRQVPRALALWRLAAIALLAVNTLATLYDREWGPAKLTAIAGLLYLPFEPVIGLWLLIRGFYSVPCSHWPQPLAARARGCFRGRAAGSSVGAASSVERWKVSDGCTKSRRLSWANWSPTRNCCEKGCWRRCGRKACRTGRCSTSVAAQVTCTTGCSPMAQPRSWESSSTPTICRRRGHWRGTWITKAMSRTSRVTSWGLRARLSPQT